MGQVAQRDGLVGLEPGQPPGLGHGGVEAAQLVHQAQVPGLQAGPDPAPGDLAHPLHRQLAAVGHPLDEAVIDPVHPAGVLGPLLRREGLTAAEGPGIVVADGDLAGVDAEPRQRRAQHELAAEHADGAGQGGGIGHDLRRAGGDPVAAGRRIGAHGHHHRLARRPGRPDGGQDLFRGRVRPAGGGDAEDDGLDGLVLHRGAEGAGHVVGIDAVALAEARGMGGAGDDLPLRGDHGDGRAGAGEVVHVIAGEIDEAGLAVAHHPAQGGLGLLHLADLVHQADGAGLFGVIGTGLQRVLQLLTVHLAVGCGGGDLRQIDRGQPADRRFPVGGGVVVIEVGIDGVLVLVALLVVGLDPVLVEGALEEHLLRGQAHGLEGGRRLHPQLVGGGAHHVAGRHDARRIEALAVGHHQLAAAPEVAQGVADLVGGAGGHAPFRQADQQGLHMGVGLRLPQSLDDGGHRQGLAVQEGQGVVRRLVADRPPQVEAEDGVGRRRGRPGAGGDHGDQQDRQADEEQAEAREHAGHGQEELFQRGIPIPASGAAGGCRTRPHVCGRRTRVCNGTSHR